MLRGGRSRAGECPAVLRRLSRVGDGYEPLFPLIASNLAAVTLGRRGQVVEVEHAELSVANSPLALSRLAQTLDARLRRITEILKPDNLPTIDRAQTQECLLALEEMKMLLSELQLIQLREK